MPDEEDAEVNSLIDTEAKDVKVLLNDFGTKLTLAEKNIKLGDVGRGHTKDGI